MEEYNEKSCRFLWKPSKNGITRKLINRVIDGAKSQDWEVVFYDLNTEGIRGCQHCYYCREHERCLINDPLAEMYKDIAEAGAIIFGTPIYFYSLSGQSKIWLDCLFPMFDTPSYKSRFPGKKSVTIFVQGYEDPTLYQSVFDDMNDRFNRWKWTVVDSILSAGNLDATPALLERAF